MFSYVIILALLVLSGSAFADSRDGVFTFAQPLDSDCATYSQVTAEDFKQLHDIGDLYGFLMNEKRLKYFTCLAKKIKMVNDDESVNYSGFDKFEVRLKEFYSRHSNNYDHFPQSCETWLKTFKSIGLCELEGILTFVVFTIDTHMDDISLFSPVSEAPSRCVMKAANIFHEALLGSF